jgi:NADH-quinone oxidoreductase subunit J
MILVYLVIGGCVIVGAVAAVLLKSLLRSAIALGFGSAALATLFFMLGAPYAGGFELSVGAGLISVLFIIVISLSESPRRQPRDP